MIDRVRIHRYVYYELLLFSVPKTGLLCKIFHFPLPTNDFLGAIGQSLRLNEPDCEIASKCIWESELLVHDDKVGVHTSTSMIAVGSRAVASS